MTLSGGELARILTELGLVPVDEVAEVQQRLADEGRSPDVEALVRCLVGSGRLTNWQAQQLVRGRVDELTFGQYAVLDEIGAGGMGRVFKARHRRMDRLAAVKVLSPSQLSASDGIRRFYREARAAARLNHPNVVLTYDAAEQNGSPYLVMEYVEGHVLSDIVRNEGPLPVDQAVDVVTQAARGLEAAHQLDIVHRDVKPSNLIRDQHGRVKVLDLGLAHIDDGLDTALTEPGQIMGTVDFMSPERPAP